MELGRWSVSRSDERLTLETSALESSNFTVANLPLVIYLRLKSVAIVVVGFFIGQLYLPEKNCVCLSATRQNIDKPFANFVDLAELDSDHVRLSHY